jgi:rubredoxin
MKNRDYSLTLEGLIVAQSRLSTSHSLLPVLAAKQASVEAGIGGEERVAEIFRRHSFSFANHLFHDLSPSSDEKFQMDTVALTPWFGVVLEVKNIGGVLEFKDNPPQLIRTREDGHKDGFESPVVQLERNQDLLGTFLQGRNIRLPIYGAVVLAYPKQIVAVPPAKTKLLFPNLLPTYIRSLPQQGKKLDHETFNWLSAELLHSHQPFVPKPISEAYKIPYKDFKPGVRCGVCGRIGMVKLPRTWYCPFCEATDHLAHERNLREWFLIFKRTITNRECREFLGVDDIDTAKRILQSMDLTPEGKNRYRLYRADLSKLIKKP